MDITSNSKASDVGTDMVVFAILLARQDAHVLGKTDFIKETLALAKAR
ncbi:MAG: hypothetical protein AAGB24_15380 [Bacteroidota bacterium]